jgi:predicted AAA+ superfamily ATPase
MYLPRLIEGRLRRLTEEFPAVVVTGARQVGKTTLVENVFTEAADYVVFDPAIDVAGAREDPDLFLDNRSRPLILDEIQYAPELVGAIKRRIDRDRAPGQYILTGSQQWGMLKTMAESLAGRAVFLELEGFCLAEMWGHGSQQSWLEGWLEDPAALVASNPRRLTSERPVYEQLWRGWLPQTHFLPLDTIPDFHAGYQRTYIERDARLAASVSDWQQFGTLFRLVAALTAQEINHSQLGRDLGMTPQTAGRWLDILRATYQWFDVPAWYGSTVKRVSGKPKGYIADTGIACAAQAISSPQSLGAHPLWGALFETAVAAEVRKLCATFSPAPNIYHWRSHGGAEVDLLLERDGKLYPIEVKSSTHPGRKDARGMQAFRETYPRLQIQKGLILAPTDQVYQASKDDWVMPWDLSG